MGCFPEEDDLVTLISNFFWATKSRSQGVSRGEDACESYPPTQVRVHREKTSIPQHSMLGHDF